jgi:glycine/D-amino acid oxidase-like deaminating enzyme
VGATYNWQDKTSNPSEEGKTELLARINEILDCKFEIIDHFAGVRPTVRDRKPLVGTHSNFPRLHILNGLGTRGVMLGPALAIALFDSIEYQKPLDIAIDIKRYDKKI